MEPLFVGIGIGFILGAAVVGFFWSEYKKSENE